MVNRMIHPSPDQVHWAGLAAMVGGALGVVWAPLYSLAYFASSDGTADAQSAGVRAWAEPARDLLDPVLTFASPDAVRVTYFKLFLFIVIGLLAGVVGLHARQAGHGGRLERWGFRASFAGLLLLAIGALSAYWPPLMDLAFPAFILPGLLLVVLGSPIFGLGTWRAGVAPRIGAGLLTIGGPAMLVISDVATLGGGLVLVYLAWVVLGHALWAERRAGQGFSRDAVMAPFAALTRRHEGGTVSKIVALVISAAAIAVAIPAPTSTASGGAGPQVFSLLEVEGPAWPLDPGATAARPPLGSRFAFTSSFYKWEGGRRGDRVARRDGVCTWIKIDVAAQSSTILCTGVFFLPGGQIYSTGMIRFAKHGRLPDVPVIGGTGRYANVRGFIKIREVGRGKAILEFHLTP